MGFKNSDLQRNNIVKKLGALLPQIDPRVKWTDYIPEAVIHTGDALVAIGMDNGCVKYINISGKSPFKLVNEVLNAMDDYRLDVQFLNARQMKEIEADINMLAKDRAKVAADILEMLEESHLSNSDCLSIVAKAQSAGIFPEFFPETEELKGVTIDILKKFLKTNAATFIDTQIISDLVIEQIEKNKEKDEDSGNYER